MGGCLHARKYACRRCFSAAASILQQFCCCELAMADWELCSDTPTLPLPPCSAPLLDAVPKGPHSADLTLTPPTVGTPIDHYNVTICLAPALTACFDKQCSHTAPLPTSVTTCIITAADCTAPAIDCLRADSAYRATAVAVRADGISSMTSLADDFQTPKIE